MSNTQNAYNHANTSFTLGLPDWAVEKLNALPKYLASVEERMAAVIEFSRRNFQRNTGGPFAVGKGPELEEITGLDEGPIHPDGRAASPMAMPSALASLERAMMQPSLLGSTTTGLHSSTEWNTRSQET